jgi:hypothetical protein
MHACIDSADTHSSPFPPFLGFVPSLSDEAEEFIKLLDSRELAASAEQGVLVHLLLRADSINRRTTDWRKLKVNSFALCRFIVQNQHTTKSLC